MRFILKLALSLILLGVIIWQLGGLGEVGRLLMRINPLYVILILVVTTLDRALMAYKWTFLLKSRGMYLSFFQGLKIYCASMIWGMFLPSTVGADAIRAFATSKTGLSSNEVVASIIVERMVGFLSALLMGIMSLFLISQIMELDSRFDKVWWGSFILLLGSMIAFAVSLSRSLFDMIFNRFLTGLSRNRIVKRLRGLHESYCSYQTGKRQLLIFFALTFLEQFYSIINAWLICIGLGVNVSFVLLVGIIPLSILISRLPISLDGIGVFEGVLIVLMALAGISASEAFSIAIISRFLIILALLPWWFAYTVETRQLKAPKVA